MDLTYTQPNFGLNWNLDIATDEETTAYCIGTLYKLKVSNNFKQIMLAIIILQVAL